MNMLMHCLYMQLQDVADGYDAGEAVLLEDRHMAEFALCHSLHNVAD